MFWISGVFDIGLLNACIK